MKRIQNWRDYLNDENFESKEKIRKKSKQQQDNEPNTNKKQYKRK